MFAIAKFPYRVQMEHLLASWMYGSTELSMRRKTTGLLGDMMGKIDLIIAEPPIIFY